MSNDIKKKLYLDGIEAFNSHEFYNAHEYWEDLWSDFRLRDADFIQGLIQLSVGYFHITNFNRNGALGLLNKCKKKLASYKPIHREVDIDYIFICVNKSIDFIEKNPDLHLKNFNWELIPKLKGIYE